MCRSRRFVKGIVLEVRIEHLVQKPSKATVKVLAPACHFVPTENAKPHSLCGEFFSSLLLSFGPTARPECRTNRWWRKSQVLVFLHQSCKMQLKRKKGCTVQAPLLLSCAEHKTIKPPGLTQTGTLLWQSQDPTCPPAARIKCDHCYVFSRSGDGLNDSLFFL